jgi:hypothetical protein
LSLKSERPALRVRVAEVFVDADLRVSRLGAAAAVGKRSNQLGSPRPVFSAAAVVDIALGVDVAGPRKINCVKKAS